MSVILSEEELKNLCQKWQVLLGLSEWEIALSIAPQHKFANGQGQGECKWVLQRKAAIIYILDPADYPDGPFEQDMEETLVHELLHLHYAPFDNTASGSLEETCLEQSIHFISNALVRLKRTTNIEEDKKLVLNGRDIAKVMLDTAKNRFLRG